MYDFNNKVPYISPLFSKTTDILLSKNICLLLKNNYSTTEISSKSLQILTENLTFFIENLSEKVIKCAEFSSRKSPNLIDVLFAFNFKGINKDKILSYIKETKLSSNSDEINNINSEMLENIKKESRAKAAIIRRLNCISTKYSGNIPKKLIYAIPKHLRVFPMEFAIKKTENCLERKNTLRNKMKNDIKKLEKRCLEEIISGNEYKSNSGSGKNYRHS